MRITRLWNLALAVVTITAAPLAAQTTLNTSAIGQALGRSGQMQGDVYFMHFWVVGAPEKVAAGLRAAVDVLKK